VGTRRIDDGRLAIEKLEDPVGRARRRAARG